MYIYIYIHALCGLADSPPITVRLVTFFGIRGRGVLFPDIYISSEADPLLINPLRAGVYSY